MEEEEVEEPGQCGDATVPDAKVDEVGEEDCSCTVPACRRVQLALAEPIPGAC